MDLRQMDIKTMKKIGDFLEGATPIQLKKMAEDIAEKAPHLLATHIETSQKRLAVEFIQLRIHTLIDTAKIETPDYAYGYVKGLIDCAKLSGLLDANTVEQYTYELKQKRSELDKEDA